MTTDAAVDPIADHDLDDAAGPKLGQALWAVAAAFGCYFCMYGFRKPFTAAGFADATAWGWGFKTVLITVQTIGYMLSKFLGIRVVAAMRPERRAAAILGLVIASESALVLFGLLPRPWNAVGLFGNGLALGMVFGLVLGFLEGRRSTEALAAGLCASFILADGVTKTVGSWLLDRGVSEDWMPAAAGGIYFVPLAICVAMLARVAPPTKRDVASRSARAPMTREERSGFLRRYAVGLVPIVVMYLMVTIARSIRADFAPELWTGLGRIAAPSTFTSSEMWVALCILLVNGAAVLIRDNRAAFFVSLATCAAGFVLMAATLLLRRSGGLDGFAFMVLAGIGLYLPYVAVHTTVFERLIAMTRDRGNVGFLMYVADAFGYLGYVVVMLSKNAGVGGGGGTILSLFEGVCWASIAVSLVGLVVSWRYFARRVEGGRPAVESRELLTNHS